MDRAVLARKTRITFAARFAFFPPNHFFKGVYLRLLLLSSPNALI